MIYHRLDIELQHNQQIKKKKKKKNNSDAEEEETKIENDAYDIENRYHHQNGHKAKQKDTTTKKTEIVTIYTWGNKIRKKAPIDSQHNTNVCGVVGYKPHGVDLKHLNGKDERIQHHVANGKNYDLYANNLKSKIMKDGLRTISINCHKGRHRSVAFAELLAKDLRNNHGYQVKVIHLEI